jgi:hypothetical protein
LRPTSNRDRLDTARRRELLLKEIRSGDGISFAAVKKRLDRADVVIAIWYVSEGPPGMRWMVIKGQQALRECIASGKPWTSRMVGIPCVDGDQAEALLQVTGERDELH